MTDCKEFQFGLVCLLMAAFTGLAGFAIVYHYATSQRPIEQFAIVIDAGSTQTRSSLFTIGVNIQKLTQLSDEDEDDKDQNSTINSYNFNKNKQVNLLSEMIEIKQVSTCVNGGPLAQIQSELNAKQLVNKCLIKFAHHIRKLDFLNLNEDENKLFDSTDLEENNLASLDADEVAERLALLNHRVNSMTHMHLGATAGMRALSIINNTRAEEKMTWIDKAIEEINNNLISGPYINKGFVNIITGSEEAAFGWTSVNFVCDKLEAKHGQQLSFVQLKQQQISEMNKTKKLLNSIAKYNIEDDKESISKDVNIIQNKNESHDKIANIQSIGTIELGGASSQISFQIPNYWNEDVIKNISMEQKNLQLFNRNYNLATRSDLCLGMSQAVLRVKFVLLRDNYNENFDSPENNLIKIENPCFQNGSITNLTKSDIIEILKAPCLVGSDLDLKREDFKTFMNNSNSKTNEHSLKTYQFIGTGNTEQCDILLSKLLIMEKCKLYFSLCPKSVLSNKEQTLPDNMPFVTISGYNKALQVLKLDKKIESKVLADGKVKNNSNYYDYYETIETIQDKLGGYSIDYQQFVDEYKKFCSIDINLISKLFPTMHKVYYTVNCLQLVYINKLLTEFYSFDPLVSWKQLKFLLFPVKAKKLSKHDDKNDIGWSLGFLLNATSNQFLSDNGKSENIFGTIMYHHGASVLFIMRTTVFLIFACVLIAISLIVLSIFVSRSRKRHREAYINHSHDRVYTPTSINV